MAGDVRFIITVDDQGRPAIRDFDKALDDLGNTASSKAAGGFGKLWQQMALGQMAWDAARKAIRLVKDAIEDSIKAAVDQERVERSLVTALELTGRTVAGNKEHYLAFAQQQMKVTTYTDDEIEATQALLLQMTRLGQDGIDKATKGAMGLATTMGIDLHSATMMVTKAMEGNYGALGRIGIKIDENLPAQEKQAQLLEKLGVLYGRTTAETDTFGGRLTQLKNSWGEVLETAGTAVIQNESVQRGMAKLKETTDKLAQSSDFKLWLSIIVDGLVKAAETAGKFAGACKNLMDNVFGAKKADDDFAASQDKLNASIAIARDAGHDLGAKVKEFVGPIQDLNAGVIETGNQVPVTTEKIKSLKEELSLTFTADTEERIKKLNEALVLYRGKLTAEQVEKIRKEIDDLSKSMKTNLAPAAADVEKYFDKSLDAMEKFGQEALKGLKTTSDDVSEAVFKGAEDAAANWEKNLKGIDKKTEETTKDCSNWFDGLMTDIARGFGDTIQKWISGATTFRDFLKGIWGNIKDAFFNMVGELVTKWTTGLLTGILTSTKKAASSITDAAGSLVKGFSDILSGGLASGIGAFLGTFLGGLFGGGPSGHAQQQQVNDTKDSRNFLADIKNLLFWMDKNLTNVNDHIFEKLDEVKGFIARLGDEQLGPRIDSTNAWLRDIEGNTRALKNLTKAQQGWSGVVSRPTLFLAGERGPEHVTVTPNINIRPGQTVISLDGRALAMAITPYLTRLERDGVKKSGY